MPSAFTAALLLSSSAVEAQATDPEAEGNLFNLLDVPELLVNGYTQDDTPEGPVRNLGATGFNPIDAVQDDPKKQPTYGNTDSGISFAAGSRQHLNFGHVDDALKSYRWMLLLLKVEPPNSAEDRVTLLSVNEDELAGGRVPRVEYSGKSGISVSWRGQGPSGSRTYSLSNHGLIADGETWNIVLVYRRHGRLFLSVNGQSDPEVSDTLTFSAPSSRKDAKSFIGDPQGGSLGWSFDAIIFGQTELSEALADKIVGWAARRIGSLYLLPEEFAYRSEPPMHDERDFPARYSHDEQLWSDSWYSIPENSRMEHLGKPLPSDEGYVRVFLDDFRENSVSRSDASEGGQGGIWFAPGWNGGVGKDAQLENLKRGADLYTHDPDSSTLTLSIGFDKQWKGSAIYSVNDVGQGRSWEGGGIFRARVKLPEIDGNPGVGFFPAILWFYNLEHLFWRTSERIEIDGFEFEGNDDQWINGGSAHVHAGEYPGKFGHLEKDIAHEKMFAARLDIDIWDGKFHLWELRIEPDFTYLGVDGTELARVATPREFLERVYMIADYALRLKHGEPDQNVRHDMVLDYIEVLQREEKLEGFTKPFSARPTIVGEALVGKTLHCAADLETDIKDIWYYWYSDGYPRGFSPDPKYEITQSDSGSEVRCMMKLVGAVNQPEAWSDKLRVGGA